MRWPFGPPHLTLKPSKKNKKNKTKSNKNKQKKEKPRKKKKKTQKIQKKSFSVISQNFPFLTGYPKIAFFDTLAQKTRTPKHYKNRGFSLFWKKVMRHGTAIFGQKTQIQKFQLSFFFAFFLFQKQKHKNLPKPLFL